MLVADKKPIRILLGPVSRECRILIDARLYLGDINLFQAVSVTWERFLGHRMLTAGNRLLHRLHSSNWRQLEDFVELLLLLLNH